MKNIEYHPLLPFLPSNSKLLMLGSFPPPKERWSMDFFYPNLQNDMWRIFGTIFFKDKDYFLIKEEKRFDKNKLEKFLSEKGIALFDTAKAVIRHKNNASDNFLEIIEPINLPEILKLIPGCKAIITTGQKASDTLASITNATPPKIGDYTDFTFEESNIRFYRMPSSSRAYPLALEKKAEIYKTVFTHLGMISPP